MSRQTKSFKPVSFHQNRLIQNYRVKIEQQNQLLKRIKTALIAPVAQHLLYCVILNKKCLLYVDAEECMAQLHFYQPIILNALADLKLTAVNSIEVRLTPAQTSLPVRHLNLPSEENIKLLQDNARFIEDDELKQAFSRLSQTLANLSLKQPKSF